MAKIEETNMKGEIIIHQIWKEHTCGYEDEELTGEKIEISSDGQIMLTQYDEYLVFSPGGHSNIKKTTYKVTVDELRAFFMSKGIKGSDRGIPWKPTKK